MRFALLLPIMSLAAGLNLPSPATCTLVRTRPLLRAKSPTLNDSAETSSPATTSTVPDEESVAVMSWPDVGAGCAIFFLLQLSTLSVIQVLGLATNGAAVAAVRAFVTGGFSAVQQSVGLPVERWLTTSPISEQPPSPEFLPSPFAPVVSAAAFAALVAAVGTVSGSAWLPDARALPDAGRALDLLIAAPLTEEAVFRGWLLQASTSAGASPLASAALSATLFALWHAPQCTGPAELGFFAALGAWLALL